jgi:hypothetical protein
MYGVINGYITVYIMYVQWHTYLLYQCLDNIKWAFSNSVKQQCLTMAVSSVAVRILLDQQSDDWQFRYKYYSI